MWGMFGLDRYERHCGLCNQTIFEDDQIEYCPGCHANLHAVGVSVDFDSRCDGCGSIISDRKYSCDTCGKGIELPSEILGRNVWW